MENKAVLKIFIHFFREEILARKRLMTRKISTNNFSNWNVYKYIKDEYQFQFLKSIKKFNLLCPFHIEDKMVVTKARHTGDGTSSIFSAVEVDEGESL